MCEGNIQVQYATCITNKVHDKYLHSQKKMFYFVISMVYIVGATQILFKENNNDIPEHSN